MKIVTYKLFFWVQYIFIFVNLQKESQSITIKLIDLKTDIICVEILFSMRFMCWSLVKNKSYSSCSNIIASNQNVSKGVVV
jgi:hypothetical protein